MNFKFVAFKLHKKPKLQLNIMTDDKQKSTVKLNLCTAF